LRVIRKTPSEGAADVGVEGDAVNVVGGTPPTVDENWAILVASTLVDREIVVDNMVDDLVSRDVTLVEVGVVSGCGVEVSGDVRIDEVGVVAGGPGVVSRDVRFVEVVRADREVVRVWDVVIDTKLGRENSIVRVAEKPNAVIGRSVENNVDVSESQYQLWID
jgi:hypothetical protein